MSRTFPIRSQAARAAMDELGSGKFFRTTQTPDGDWRWHYEPGDSPGLEFDALEYVEWIETDWDRSIDPPLRIGVLIVTCRREEIEETFSENIRVEPITPELFDEPSRPSTGKPRAAAPAGQRARSEVESPVKLVWRLADEMIGSPRSEVIAACVAAGVNKATASTQFYRWQKAKSV